VRYSDQREVLYKVSSRTRVPSMSFSMSARGDVRRACFALDDCSGSNEKLRSPRASSPCMGALPRGIKGTGES